MGFLSHSIDFAYGIGYFSKVISFFLVCFLVFKSPLYLVSYILLYIFNRLFNSYIKTIFKQKRPLHPVKYLDKDTFNRQKFGLPSGHVQLTFFSIVYLFMVIHGSETLAWKLFMLFVGLLSIYQAIVFKMHTWFQVIIAAILGSFIAYVSVMLIHKGTKMIRITPPTEHLLGAQP